MVNDAHRQTRGASEQSLERIFNDLTELKRRQVDCEDVIHVLLEMVEQNALRLDSTGATIEAGMEWRREFEQAVKDAFAAIFEVKALEREEPQEAMASGEWRVPAAVHRPGCPQLRVILGGLAVAAFAALVPAGAAAVTHHSPARHHIAAMHSRRRAAPDRDADPRVPGDQVGL